MRDFFDTSVLIAAHLSDHPHHPPSLTALARATRATSSCAAHSLAEIYSVLTRLPVRPLIPPEQVMLFLNDVRDRLTILTLDEAVYGETLEAAASRGVTGGRIYDALLLRCAADAQAETIYTWNIKHFQQLAPELADRIRTPVDQPRG